MASETWRVVLRDGSVREVRSPDGVSGDAARVAVLRECALWHHPVAEILAPGELTRAEAVAAAQTAGAEAVRDAVMGYLDEVFPDGPAATDERWPHELMEHVACAVARAKRSARGV